VPTVRDGRTGDAAVAVAVAVLGSAGLGALLGAFAHGWPRSALVVVGEIPAAAAVFALVTKWRWWRRVGWHAPSGNTWLVWLPALMAAGPVGIVVHEAPSPSRLLAALAAVLMIGFTEEMWFRGVLLESLLARGERTAVLVSAATFGALHIANARFFGLPGASAQAVAAFGVGLMYGACRVRIRSIWPFIGLHALVDLPFLLIKVAASRVEVSLAVVPSLVTLVGAALTYALVLTRNREPKPAELAAIPERMNYNAVGSLVCGIAGFFLLLPAIPALILGYRARRQIRGAGGAERGDGRALAGIILGYVVVGLVGVSVAVAVIGAAGKY